MLRENNISDKRYRLDIQNINRHSRLDCCTCENGVRAWGGSKDQSFFFQLPSLRTNTIVKLTRSKQSD